MLFIFWKLFNFYCNLKVDLLKSKRKLLDLTRTLTENCINGIPTENRPSRPSNLQNKGWKNFHDVFMVSALTGINFLY